MSYKAETSDPNVSYVFGTLKRRKVLDLPPEIFALILQSVHTEDSSEPYLLRVSDEHERLKNLQACCLVNRDWHTQSVPLLNSRFENTGDENSFAKLWHFLRTIVENPELIKFVKQLDFRDRGSWDFDYNRRVTQPEQRLRRREFSAISAIANQLKLRQLTEARQWQVRSPFMAILTTCLPSGCQKKWLEGHANLYGKILIFCPLSSHLF